jgi:UDP-glucose 4-epimerase
VRASWGESFEIYTRSNILATQRLLEASKEVPVRKLVYASSSSIYGDAETFPTPEGVTPAPISPYGVTKLAAEHLSLLYWRNYQVPTVGLRYFTVYGPRQRPDMAFHRFIRAMAEGQQILVYGDGEQTRDFTYVDDAVEGTVGAAFAEIAGDVLNLGGGSRVSVNQVIEMLERIMGRAALVHHVAPGQGDVRHTSADTSRAAAAISFAPRTTLSEGLRAEADWFGATLQERAVGS